MSDRKYGVTVYEVTPESDYDYFTKDVYRKLDIVLSSAKVDFIELNGVPVIVYIEVKEEENDNGDTIKHIITRLVDVSTGNNIEQLYNMPEPYPKNGADYLVSIKAYVDDEDNSGGFTVFVATCNPNGNIYVQPFSPKSTDADGNLIEGEESIASPLKKASNPNQVEGKAKKKALGKKAKCLIGHQKKVSSLCVHKAKKSGSSSYLVSGSDDKTVRLWNPITFQMVHLLQGHRDSICDIASLSHPSETVNKEYIVTAAVTGNICVWDCDTGDLIRKLFDDAFTGIKLCFVNIGNLTNGDSDSYGSQGIMSRIVSSGKRSISVSSIFCIRLFKCM